MRSDHSTEIKGIIGTVNISSQSLLDIETSIAHLETLFNQDITAVINEFKHEISRTQVVPPISKAIQIVLQETCDQLLSASLSKEQAYDQKIAALKKQFEEKWAHELAKNNWVRWFSRDANPRETSLKDGLLVLFEVLEDMNRSGLKELLSQLGNAAFTIDINIKSINQIVNQHNNILSSFNQNYHEKIKEMNNLIQNCLASSSWHQELKKIDNRLKTLMYESTNTLHDIGALNDLIYQEIPQTCASLASEKYNLMSEANKILLSDKNEQKLEQLYALENKCKTFRQHINALSDTYTKRIVDLQTILSLRQKEQLEEVDQYIERLLSHKNQFAQVESTVITLRSNVEKNIECSDIVINKITDITRKARNEIQDTIRDLKQYQEQIATQLQLYLGEIKNQMLTSNQNFMKYQSNFVNGLKPIKEKIDSQCSQVTHPNFISSAADNDNSLPLEPLKNVSGNAFNDPLKKYYDFIMITIYNLQESQQYLSKVYEMINDVKLDFDIRETYTKMNRETEELSKTLSLVFADMPDKLSSIIHNEETLVEQFGAKLDNSLQSLYQIRTNIQNVGDIKGKALVEKSFGIYYNLQFKNKKKQSSIFDEIQRQREPIESKREDKIYQRLNNQHPINRSAAAFEDKILYLKKTCRLYRKHFASKGKSARNKLKIVNSLFQTLNNPPETNPADQVLAFQSQVDFFEKQLILPRDNRLTKFLKAVACFVLPFDAVRKKLYHVKGADFVTAARTVSMDGAGGQRSQSTTYIACQEKLKENNPGCQDNIKQLPLDRSKKSNASDSGDLKNHSFFNSQTPPSPVPHSNQPPCEQRRAFP